MEQRLQLNQVIELPKKGEKIIVLELTDIQLHSNARPTQSVGGAIRRSIENNKPGRVFSSFETEKTDENQLTLKMKMPFVMNDPALKQAIHDYQQQGYRVMLQVPKAGLPIMLGKDAQEFMKSTKGKRIMRKIDKDKEY